MRGSLRQRPIPTNKTTGEQDGTSNGGQRPSLNSGFPPRRGWPIRSAKYEAINYPKRGSVASAADDWPDFRMGSTYEDRWVRLHSPYFDFRWSHQHQDGSRW